MAKLIQTKKERIYQKYDGKCVYSGTPLEKDWQIDHVQPIRRNIDGSCLNPINDTEINLVPTQKLINHYKGSMTLQEFRERLNNLHLVLIKLPKNPRTEKSWKRTIYMITIADYFGITPNSPFNGIFYFENK
ncbi:MAG: hypothetical protein M0O93_06775 [Bacteroidales bacterium]|nr:hypothetical protein [Bacteroidales bacterium]